MPHYKVAEHHMGGDADTVTTLLQLQPKGYEGLHVTPGANNQNQDVKWGNTVLIGAAVERPPVEVLVAVILGLPCRDALPRGNHDVLVQVLIRLALGA